MRLDDLLVPLAIGLITLGALGLWPGLTRRTVLPTALSVGAVILELVVLSQTRPAPPQLQRQEAPGNCISAGFPVCPPFKDAYVPNRSFYGPAVTFAFMYQGLLTQCFERGCLQHFPDNPPEFQVQGMLLGEEYREKVAKIERQALSAMALSPLFLSWDTEFRRSHDIHKLLGEQLTGELRGIQPNEVVVIFQRAVLAFPEGAQDTAQIQPLPLGQPFYRDKVTVEEPRLIPVEVLPGILAVGYLFVILSFYRALLRPSLRRG